MRVWEGLRVWQARSVLLALAATGYLAGVETSDRPPLLEPDKTLDRELSGGESHQYLFALKAGEYAKVLVAQRSVNVAVECDGPDGKQVYAADSHVVGDTEVVQLVAEMSGTHGLRVTAPDKAAPMGRYSITLSEVVPATERHKRLAAGASAFAQAMASAAMMSRKSLQSAVERFEEALVHWHAAGDLFEEARTTAWIGLYSAQLGERQKALEYTARALSIAKESPGRRFERWALTDIGIVHVLFEDKRKAADYFHEALPLMEAAGDLLGKATIDSYLGRVLVETGEPRRGLEYLERSLSAYREIQSRADIVQVVSNIGITYSRLGEYQRAIEKYEESLTLARQLGNRGAENILLNNIGSNYSDQGNYQKALDYYVAALEIARALDNRRSMATNLHNIAWVHGVLGDYRRALQYYQQALELLRAHGERYPIANTLNNIGATYGNMGDYASALKFHLEALSYRRQVGDADGEGVTLTNIGKWYEKLGDLEKGRENLERAVAILRSTERRDRLAAALRSLGMMHRSAREFARAVPALDEALAISREIRDRRGEAEGLAEMARVERDGGDFARARQRAEEALAAFESIRQGVMSPTLRATFVASVRDVQEIEVEALVRLHEQEPDKGFGAAALLASERGRARSLLEMLGEAGAEIRRGVDAGLLARERELQQAISTKAALQTRRLAGKHSDAEEGAARKELDGLTEELEQVQGRIREDSPQYAALTQPTPLNLSEIQSKVLDEDTVLLEYALGVERSYLWAVSKSSVNVYVLPARAEVERTARRVYKLLTARNQKPAKETPAARLARIRESDAVYQTAARKASEMLLGPARSAIGDRRLLIVGEGVLNYLPFGALPEPGTDVPLILGHEIVTAPSASVVALLRQEMGGRAAAPKTLAVFADPVFSADDARVRIVSKAAARSGPDFVRLRFSRTEADEIARLAPAEGTFKAVDFDASREGAMKSDLREYRIVHFATHSLLDDEHPELSGVVLSLADREGRPQNGFLRLYDIYNLRLGADLVVLSACRTALGQEIKGEGLIGLTRGFLYAGAPRVMATLWEIDDRTTEEAMKKFYEGVLVRGERPAQALRSAQVALWRTRGWEAPYYWAAFTLEGEWR
jgi:CHAT domain-containing protein/tetratricopeptide (TPR) repeat protein